MILKQDEIHEAAELYRTKEWGPNKDDDIYLEIENCEEDFIEGVKWAESKFEKLVIEFGTYCYIAARCPNDDTTTFEELFQQFMKWKNKKHDNTL